MAGLLKPEHLKCIGNSEAPVTEEISRRDIRHYAVATDQRLKKFLKGDEAPPMFYSRYFHPVETLDRMQTDGHIDDPLVPHLPLSRVMAGGCETEFHRPIRPGDTLTAKRSFVELYERDGRTGPLIFLVIETRIEDPAGEPVVVERYTRIAR